MHGRRWQLWVICFLLLTAIAAPCRAEPDAASEWKRKISAQIEAHKRFPPSVFGQTGEAKVMFLLDRSGNLIFE
jgi:protein TonB